MKRCNQCQSIEPDQAKFCSQCGASFGAVTPTPSQQPLRSQPAQRTQQQPAYAPTPVGAHPGAGLPYERKNYWPYALLALAAVVALGLGVAGLLRAQAAKNNPVLAAQSGESMPVTRVESQPSSPATHVTSPEPSMSVVMPENIRAYLKHVEETEKLRRSVAMKQLGVAKTLLAQLSAGATTEMLKNLMDPDADSSATPAKKVQTNMDDMRSDWRQVRDYFRSVQPPAECSTLYSKYDNAITETGAQIVDLIQIVDEAQSDPSAAVAKLEGLKGSSKGIDEAGKGSNDEVIKICNHYETKPWFEISSDFGGSGGMLQAFGGGF
ncbi:MAG: zinc ribbon domain-containing protein [Armatimonadetes bacterium]|nr:zinc ribbon domain-containing protein [Armatimonadota bacterium]